MIAKDAETQRKIVADRRYPLEERVEAFEDIIDSEVGDTAMVRARNIEREVGLRQIYLKFEGGNPTGTQKDRIAFEQSRTPCAGNRYDSRWRPAGTMASRWR